MGEPPGDRNRLKLMRRISSRCIRTKGQLMLRKKKFWEIPLDCTRQAVEECPVNEITVYG